MHAHKTQNDNQNMPRRSDFTAKISSHEAETLALINDYRREH